MKKTTHLLKLFSFSAFWALLLGWVIFAKLPVQATTQSNILVNSSKLDNISAALGQSATGTIAGTVTDMAGNPIANHLVQLYMYVDDPMGLSGWQQVQSVSTDASGVYTFTGNVYLNVGYKVGIHNAYGSSSPYMTEFFDNVGTLDAAAILTPTAGTPLLIANAQLKQGIIKGRVLDEQGNAIPNVSVEAENGHYVVYATVDSTGQYTITGLTADVYKVCAAANDFLNGCYGNPFDSSKAATVTLSMQSPLAENINFPLSTGGRISGRVTTEDGQPLSGIWVTPLYRIDVPPGESPWSSVSQAVTDAEGYYTVTRLISQTYRIQFDPTIAGYTSLMSEYYADAETAETAQDVPLTRTQRISGINAQLARGGVITGTVTDKNGQKVPWLWVRPWYEITTVYGTKLWAPVARFVGAEADGVYTITGLATGIYRLEIANPPYDGFDWAGEFYKDAETVDTATDIPVEIRKTVPNINFQVGRLGKIQGRVTDKQGNPIDKITVVPEQWIVNPGGNSWQSVYNGAATTDSSGMYTLTKLPAGQFRISFHEYSYNYQPVRGYASEYYNDSPTAEGALTITVAADSVIQGIDAQLGRLGGISGVLQDWKGNPLPQISLYPFKYSDCCGWAAVGYYSISTDDLGRFSLPALDSGKYTFYTYGNDLHPSQYYNGALTVEAAAPITVTSETTTTVTFRLIPYGSISGTVTSLTGSAIPSTTVTLWRNIDFGGGNFFPENMGSTQTDSQGNYAFGPLSGKTVSLPAANSTVFYVEFADTRQPAQYISEFFNNATDLNSATPVTVTVNSVAQVNAQLAFVPVANQPPVANNDAISLVRGATSSVLTGGATSLLANDVDAENAPLTATLVTNPINGALTLNANGTFTYTHNGSATTGDSFTYQVSDGVNLSNIATVTITITSSVNMPPTAQNDAISLVRGATSSVLTGGATSLLANDVDAENAPLTATVVTNPVNGALTLNANGTFTYKHNNSKTTSDLFTYRASDGINQSNIATVTITIKPLISFEFSKTVSILGIEPACGAIGTMKVPVTTTIDYCYSITNSGDVTLTTHSLVDDKLGTLLNNAAITLAPGATHRVQFSQTLTVNTTNIATWTATSNVAGLTAAELDEADVALGVKQATITISAPTDDQDGDTIPDNLESAGDADGDNLPNFLDTDANGNGTPDASEVGSNPLAPVDSNGNGVPDYLDLTAPNEGQNTKKVYLPVVSR